MNLNQIQINFTTFEIHLQGNLPVLHQHIDFESLYFALCALFFFLFAFGKRLQLSICTNSIGTRAKVDRGKKLNDFDGPGKIISVKLNKINAIVSFVLGHFVYLQLMHQRKMCQSLNLFCISAFFYSTLEIIKTQKCKINVLCLRTGKKTHKNQTFVY